MSLRLRGIGVLLVPTVALAAACVPTEASANPLLLGALGAGLFGGRGFGGGSFGQGFYNRFSGYGGSMVMAAMAAMVATAVMAAMAVMAARDMLGVFRMMGTSTAAVVTVEVGVRTGGADSLYLPDSTQPQRSGFCCGLY
jgi:hypothetical protein